MKYYVIEVDEDDPAQLAAFEAHLLRAIISEQKTVRRVPADEGLRWRRAALFCGAALATDRQEEAGDV